MYPKQTNKQLFKNNHLQLQVVCDKQKYNPYRNYFITSANYFFLNICMHQLQWPHKLLSSANLLTTRTQRILRYFGVTKHT